MPLASECLRQSLSTSKVNHGWYWKARKVGWADTKYALVFSWERTKSCRRVRSELNLGNGAAGEFLPKHGLVFRKEDVRNVAVGVGLVLENWEKSELIL